MKKTENRKNYALNAQTARSLGIHAINMSSDIGKTVPKQSILDILVGLLDDKKIYKKVVSVIKTIENDK